MPTPDLFALAADRPSFFAGKRISLREKWRAPRSQNVCFGLPGHGRTTTVNRTHVAVVTYGRVLPLEHHNEFSYARAATGAGQQRVHCVRLGLVGGTESDLFPYSPADSIDETIRLVARALETGCDAEKISRAAHGAGGANAAGDLPPVSSAGSHPPRLAVASFSVGSVDQFKNARSRVKCPSAAGAG